MAHVTVAEVVSAARVRGRLPSAMRGVLPVLVRRRFAVWLVGIASILTLGHLLGPQSELHAIDPHGHEVEHDHADAPSHDHGEHVCGQAVLPDTCADVRPATEAAIDAPHHAEPGALVAATVDIRDRSPTDPVSELQVNRV